MIPRTSITIMKSLTAESLSDGAIQTTIYEMIESMIEDASDLHLYLPYFSEQELGNCKIN